jgi:glutathione S-transferase
MSNTSIELYAFTKPENAPSPSGYCQKLETFLRASPTLSGSYTEVQLDAPTKAPKGKLPYVVIRSSDNSDSGATTLADSHIIIQHLIQNGLTPSLDTALTPSQRAESQAFQIWTDELLYPAVVTTRFGYDWPHNYDAFWTEFMNNTSLGVPRFLRPLILWQLRRGIMNSMHGHGVGRHSKAEVENRIQEWVDAVAVKLGEDGDKWFHGTEEPTLVDVVLSGFLMNSLSLDYNKEFVDMVKEKKGVVKYTVKVVKRWFPEYATFLERLESWL